MLLTVKPRLRKFSQSHPANEWWNQELNTYLSDPRRGPIQYNTETHVTNHEKQKKHLGIFPPT